VDVAKIKPQVVVLVDSSDDENHDDLAAPFSQYSTCSEYTRTIQQDSWNKVCIVFIFA